MDFVTFFINSFLHIDQTLALFIDAYGIWVYALLFFIIFAETGLVVTPFLPGDSLLFVIGALCATGALSLPEMLGLLSLAAVLGNLVNYHIGSYIGNKVFRWEDSRFFKKEYLYKTQDFYNKNGTKTLILSRFLPIFRTFAPFVAGISHMNYGLFTILNFVGALSWVFLLTLAGFFFGNIVWVKQNLSFVVVGIIAISLSPVLFAWIRKSRLKLTRLKLKKKDESGTR